MGQNIRLLRVIGGLDPSIGGPSESALNACLAVQRAGVDTSFAFPVPEGASEAVRPVRERLEGEGVTIHSFPVFPGHASKAERWGISPALTSWLMRNVHGHDVVHVHGAWGLSSLAGVVAARRAGVPSVMSPHESMTSYDVRRPGSDLRILAKGALRAFYTRRLALLVFASELEATDTLRRGDRAKGTVIYHPLRAALEIPRAPSDEQARPLRVGYLGRLHPKKNLEVLIQAVAAGSNEARLLVAGEGPDDYAATLKRLADDVGMTERLEWVGFIEGDDRWPFIDSLDLFAMPSHYECFGMAAAEAMARGVPTVVSTATGLSEIIQRHGSGLIAPPTVEGFAAAIARLEGDRDFLAGLKERSASTTPRELSMVRYAERMREEYERLVNGLNAA